VKRKMRGSATLRCPKCNLSFRVLEDEQFDHHCPNCGPEQEECEGADVMGDEIRTGDYILEHNGEIILEINAIDYLCDYLGAIKKTVGEN
jgi:predicted RNA-binding Zn-ribbon protein involved in translation (DUF1610 family)